MSVSYGHLHRLRVQVNQLIELLLNQPVSQTSEWQPPVDLVESSDGFEVRIDVPGLQREQLQLELRDQLLMVRGKKERLSSEPPSRRFFLMERFFGTFLMEVEIPHAVHPRKAEARLHQGVLSVTLPRLEDKRHRTFTIPISEETSNNE